MKKETLDSSTIVIKFSICPRCGWKTLERIKTYSYCPNCNYNSVEGLYIGDDETTLTQKKKKLRKSRKNEELVNINVSEIIKTQNKSKREENL